MDALMGRARVIDIASQSNLVIRESSRDVASRPAEAFDFLLQGDTRVGVRQCGEVLQNGLPVHIHQLSVHKYQCHRHRHRRARK